MGTRAATQGYSTRYLYHLQEKTGLFSSNLAAVAAVWLWLCDWLPQLQHSRENPNRTDAVSEWWSLLGNLQDVPRKTIRSLLLLFNWKSGRKEMQTFSRKELSTNSLLIKILEEFNVRKHGMLLVSIQKYNSKTGSLASI